MEWGVNLKSKFIKFNVRESINAIFKQTNSFVDLSPFAFFRLSELHFIECDIISRHKAFVFIKVHLENDPLMVI